MSEQGRAARAPAMPEAERVRLILEAAESVFAVSGYGAATMEEIARACGMAKKTLYRFFPDKASVFSALIDTHESPRLPWQTGEGEDQDEGEALHRLLMDMGQYILTPRQMLLTRLVIAESAQYPELAARFQEDCIARTETYLADRLRHLAPRHVEPDLLAEMVVGAVIGSVQIKSLISSRDRKVEMEELRRHAQATMALLLGPLLAAQPAA
ncbi:TetR/AcrR family transcriptional regulator [Rhizobium sp. FKL33]|uniref:TetR/AcrR family transcriptional regulator n=1 Tax=Rhizobium sp. FKL33 TaxID=2562307 RepID=UPI0010C0EF1C|nr:TetR/AcrR family transcriptional regulator [Rhizobium sp. FKL33]